MLPNKVRVSIDSQKCVPCSDQSTNDKLVLLGQSSEWENGSKKGRNFNVHSLGMSDGVAMWMDPAMQAKDMVSPRHLNGMAAACSPGVSRVIATVSKNPRCARMHSKQTDRISSNGRQAKAHQYSSYLNMGHTRFNSRAMRRGRRALLQKPSSTAKTRLSSHQLHGQIKSNCHACGCICIQPSHHCIIAPVLILMQAAKTLPTTAVDQDSTAPLKAALLLMSMRLFRAGGAAVQGQQTQSQAC